MKSQKIKKGELFDANKNGVLVLKGWSKGAVLDHTPNIEEKLELIDHSHIVSIRPGWAHSQQRVGVNITIPLH